MRRRTADFLQGKFVPLPDKVIANRESPTEGTPRERRERKKNGKWKNFQAGLIGLLMNIWVS